MYHMSIGKSRRCSLPAKAKFRHRACASSLLVLLLTASLVGAAPARAGDQVVFGSRDDAYRCGQILVKLRNDLESIENVVGRNGGVAADVLHQFGAPSTLYIVRVPIGNEHMAADNYASDRAVEWATVDRETFGYLTPDTALPLTSERRATLDARPFLLAMVLLSALCSGWKARVR